ncbi:hypothetical protein [Nonomuraea sp. NPDC003201]
MFRDAVRTYLQDIWSTPETRVLATEPFQDFMHVSGAPLIEELLAAYRAGESPRSPWAQQAVTHFMEAATALSDTPLTPEVRNRMADGFRQIPDIMCQIAKEEAASVSPIYDDTHGRYLSLVALNNGTATEEDHDSMPYAWIADAMRPVDPPTP